MQKARNIKNAAVLNVDPRAELVGRLKRERQAFLHQALIYRFSSFDTSLEELMLREDVRNYIASILEKVNQGQPSNDIGWDTFKKYTNDASKVSAAHSVSNSQDGIISDRSEGKQLAPPIPKILPDANVQDKSVKVISKSSNTDTVSSKTQSKIELSGAQIHEFRLPEYQSMESLEKNEIISLLETNQNTILEQELEVQKRERIEARETEAHNEQVDSLRVQISTKQDLLTTIKESLSHYNELREKEKAHLIQLKESEAERNRLEKELKKFSSGGSKKMSGNNVVRAQMEKKYKSVVERLKTLKSQHSRQKFLLRNLEREAARAKQLEQSITVLKSEKVSLARARKRENSEHRAWKKGKEKELLRLRKAALKQKREMQSIAADRERQRIRLGLYY